MAERQSHPVPDADLDKRTTEAERTLKTVKGSQDLQAIFMKALEKQERFRPLPEVMELLFSIRRGLSYFFYFVDLLIERTGQKGDVAKLQLQGVRTATPEILAKNKFAYSYSIFVAASYIVAEIERTLAGKNPPAPHIDMRWTFTTESTVENNLKYLFMPFADAVLLNGDDGQKIVENVDDLFAVSRLFWKTVAERAAGVCKDMPDLLEHVRNVTFKNGSFSVTGLQSENRESKQIISFPLVKPEEVVGDEDVTIVMLRSCDRIALYCADQQDNPIRTFGGLIESMMLDGPPGTGKTRRMQMMMTRLKMRAEQIGLPFASFSLTADQVKNEFYGKTAQLMKEFLSRVQNPVQLCALLLDDFDLMVSAERNVGGSDNDVMKALMDFLAGSSTNYIGNYIVVGATNRPTASDSALRQRMVYRANLLGPKSWEEYTDQVALELARFAKTGLLKVGAGRYKPLSRPLPKTLAATFDQALVTKYAKHETFEDIGHLCEDLRKKDPEFTGRSVKNALQVAVAQAADFDIPTEWFEKHEAFRAKSWEERVEMVRVLYKPLAAGQIMVALENQFNAEARYRLEAHRREVEAAAKRLKVQHEAFGLFEREK